jgi:Salmonella virulence plasmid 65kDa B protein
VRSIGEKFGTNAVTCTASMTVPIATSPGWSGFGPQLSLSYDSGSGNGPFGLGYPFATFSFAKRPRRVSCVTSTRTNLMSFSCLAWKTSSRCWSRMDCGTTTKRPPRALSSGVTGPASRDYSLTSNAGPERAMVMFTRGPPPKITSTSRIMKSA